jgi:hypothetical protein
VGNLCNGSPGVEISANIGQPFYQFCPTSTQPPLGSAVVLVPNSETVTCGSSDCESQSPQLILGGFEDDEEASFTNTSGSVTSEFLLQSAQSPWTSLQQGCLWSGSTSTGETATGLAWSLPGSNLAAFNSSLLTSDAGVGYQPSAVPSADISECQSVASVPPGLEDISVGSNWGSGGAASATSISLSGGVVSANATGIGVIAVGQYTSNPVGAASFSSSGEYFDVALLSGAVVSSVTILDCNRGAGNNLQWWNPQAASGVGGWQAVQGDPGPVYLSGPPSCMTVTLNDSTAPNLAELTGTVFGVGFTPSQSCIVTMFHGPLTIGSGQAVCIGAGGRVLGPVTLKSGGALWVTGGAVIGRLSSNDALAIRLCGATILGGETIQGTTGAVMIGDPGLGCPGNWLTGPVAVTHNTGGVELLHNSILGPVVVNGNTDTVTEIGGNRIFGSLTCSGNSPSPTDGGSPNSVAGPRFGQCAGL